MQQRFVCYLFLALFVLARAQQYTLCDVQTGCNSSSSPACTCVGTATVAGTAGCACAEALCQEYCTRLYGANCMCSAKTDSATKSVTCVVPTTCTNTQPSCTEDPTTGNCGDLSRASSTCRTYSRCGVSSNGVCAWLCPPCFDGTVTPNTCGGMPRPASTTIACTNASITCPEVGCANGFNVHCPDPCSGRCTGTPTCPSGSSLADPSAVVPCVLDATGTCNWAPNCRANTSPCLTTNGNCGDLAPLTACPPGWVLAPGTVFTPRCDTLYYSSTTSNTPLYKCVWSTNCRPGCEVVNETCGGRPKPTSCPPGSFSTTGVAPSFTCQGATSSTCDWYADSTCVAGCEFKWPADSLAPLCGGNPFPCPNVPAVLPSSTFTQVTTSATGSTTDALVSASRLNTLCYPNVDKKCVFPPITCPTGCYAQLRADRAEYCGGAVKDLSKAGCTDAQIPVAKCGASTANSAECGWVYSCVPKVVDCLKDSTRYTCGGVSVADTCSVDRPGSYMADFNCYVGTTGKCVPSPVCTDIETCSADLSQCLSSTTATGTATSNFAPTSAPACNNATETQVSPVQCCCSKVTVGKCYFKGLRCVPKDPCTTCKIDATVKTECPAGTRLLSLPSCVSDSTGKCAFTPIRCTPIPVPTCNGNCPVVKPCDFGFVSRAVTCDPACNGIPECAADPCTTSDPCKCNKANGCVWIVGPAGSTQRSFCASSSSQIVTSANVPGSINNGADFCKPSTTPPKDHVIDAVTTNSYTGSNLQAAITNFIAQVKALDSKLCTDGSLCLLKYSVSFFAVGAPELSTDGTKNLKLYATVLFLPRDPANDPGTPSQEVLNFYCEPIMRLIGTLSKAFNFDVDKNRLGTCSFTISLKRDALQSGTTAYQAGVQVPADVYQKYISASPSLISGCLLVISALVALFLLA